MWWASELYQATWFSVRAESQELTYINTVYELVPAGLLYPATLLKNTAGKYLVLKLHYGLVEPLPVYETEGQLTVTTYLHEILLARITTGTDYLKGIDVVPTRFDDQPNETIIYTWELAAGSAVPDQITIELYAEDRNRQPYPFVETLNVTTIDEPTNPGIVIETSTPSDDEQIPNDDSCPRGVDSDLHEDPTVRMPTITVLGSLVVPDKLNPNRVTLVVLPLTPDCDISFGAIALKNQRGQTEKLEEKRTEWGKTNAVQMMRPLAGKRIPRCIQIQYVAWLRPSGMPGPVTEVLLQGA
jgi:hypothetical protein